MFFSGLNYSIAEHLLSLKINRVKLYCSNIPLRTSRNFFRLGSAFLEGEVAELSLKKLRKVQTQIVLKPVVLKPVV